MTKQLPLYIKIGRAIISSPIYIIKRTWKWVFAFVLLLAVTHSVATFVLGRQVENEIGKIKANGDPVACAELAGKPIPDAENGAIIYEKAFKKISIINKPIYEGTYYFDIISTKHRNDPKAWERARKAVMEHRDVFTLIEKAAAMPQCRFKISWKDGAYTLLPHFVKLRELTRLLAVKAIIDAKDGRTDQALSSINLIFSLRDSIKDEPILFAELTRVAILSIANNVLQYVANHSQINNSQAQILISKISHINLLQELIAAIKGDRTVVIDVFERIKNQDAKIFYYSQRTDSGPSSLISRLEVTSYLGRPLLYLDEINSIKKMNDLNIGILSPSRNGLISCKETKSFLIYSLALEPSFVYARRRIDTSQTELTGSQLLLALRAYNNQYRLYPETLAELKNKTSFKITSEDPFSGKDFIYKRQGSGFVLYSIGEDLKDDGGISITNTNTRPYKGDIVWKLSH